MRVCHCVSRSSASERRGRRRAALAPRSARELGDAAPDPAACAASRTASTSRSPRSNATARPAGVVALGARAARAPRGRAAAASARAPACVSTLAPDRHLVEDEGVGELQVQLELVGGELRMQRARPARTASRTNSSVRCQPIGLSGVGTSTFSSIGRPETRYISRISARSRVVVARGEAARDDLDRAAVELRQHRRRARRSPRARRGCTAPRARRRRRGSSSCEVEKPSAPSRIACAHQLLHRGDLGRGGRALGRVVAHDVAAHGAVADVAADVHAERGRRSAASSRRSCRRGSGSPRAQRRARHALDADEHAGEPVDVLGLRRRQREAAVAGDAPSSRRASTTASRADPSRAARRSACARR